MTSAYPRVAITAIFVAVLSGTIPDFGVAQEPRPMTVEDVLAMKSFSAGVMSPDGEWVAFVLTVRDMEENAYDSDVWVVSTDGGEPVHLTRGPASDLIPRWAPDGGWLGFISDRGEESQVWGIDPSGGEAWQVTHHSEAVGSFWIAPDGRRIASIARPEKDE